MRRRRNHTKPRLDGLAMAALLYGPGIKENGIMTTGTEIGTDQGKARSQANQQAIQERTSRRGEVRNELQQAKKDLEDLERIPPSSNETLERLTADITVHAERYAREVRHRMAMKGHLGLEDLKLESMGAQCHFSPNRVREGIKRLFPGGSGITETERNSRRSALISLITKLQAELARLGG